MNSQPKKCVSHLLISVTRIPDQCAQPYCQWAKGYLSVLQFRGSETCRHRPRDWFFNANALSYEIVRAFHFMKGILKLVVPKYIRTTFPVLTQSRLAHCCTKSPHIPVAYYSTVHFLFTHKLDLGEALCSTSYLGIQAPLSSITGDKSCREPPAGVPSGKFPRSQFSYLDHISICLMDF